MALLLAMHVATVVVVVAVVVAVSTFLPSHAAAQVRVTFYLSLYTSCDLFKSLERL
jgi:hypothetical protein